MTRHEIIVADATRMEHLVAESVALVVTSPPYPMIEMWDALFFARNGAIQSAVEQGRYEEAFELMHCELDPVWREVYRVLVPGGIACINIGDATRTLGGNFRLFSSHARILTFCLGAGFQNLPNIIWRKTTNAPNKFMGSGMLPPGAYVTLEHEYVLVLRKGTKRPFTGLEAKRNRGESAFFWEERNNWFSDVWLGLIGVGQSLAAEDARSRSAAYPFEFAYRLINMFSVKGDVVLDPFAGTGTSMLAAMASERDSVCFELDKTLEPVIVAAAEGLLPVANRRIRDRLEAHAAFVEQRARDGRPCGHRNEPYGFACMSAQEKHILIRDLASVVRRADGAFTVEYAPGPQRWSYIPDLIG
jgi:DNA modification methylase